MLPAGTTEGETDAGMLAGVARGVARGVIRDGVADAELPAVAAAGVTVGIDTGVSVAVGAAPEAEDEAGSPICADTKITGTSTRTAGRNNSLYLEESFFMSIFLNGSSLLIMAYRLRDLDSNQDTGLQRPMSYH